MCKSCGKIGAWFSNYRDTGMVIPPCHRAPPPTHSDPYIYCILQQGSTNAHVQNGLIYCGCNMHVHSMAHVEAFTDVFLLSTFRCACGYDRALRLAHIWPQGSTVGWSAILHVEHYAAELP